MPDTITRWRLTEGQLELMETQLGPDDTLVRDYRTGLGEGDRCVAYRFNSIARAIKAMAGITAAEALAGTTFLTGDSLALRLLTAMTVRTTVNYPQPNLVEVVFPGVTAP